MPAIGTPDAVHPGGPRIVVVGCGFAGASFALELLRQHRGLDVTVIERGDRFGPGLAYSTEHPSHILNSRKRRMSIEQGRPNDFCDWLAVRRPFARDFVLRRDYGAYLEARLQQEARINARLNLTSGSVSSWTPEAGRVRVALNGGDELIADAVVLAIGNLPAEHPWPINPDALGERYVHNPFDQKQLARIDADKDVLIIGAGLTMIDTMLSLAERRHSGRIIALSRRGLLPQPHVDSAGPANWPIETHMRASEAMAALRREARKAEAAGQPWQHIMDGVRAKTPALWAALPLEERQRFLRHARPWWDSHRHRAPTETLARLEALMQRDALRVLAGKLEQIEAGDAIRVLYRPRGAKDAAELRVGAIINCTGSAVNVESIDEPLLAHAREQGLVVPHQSGIGVEVDPTCRVVTRHESAAPVFALGALTQGEHWEITAVPEIRAQAEGLARHIASLHEARAERAAPAARLPRA